MRQESQRDETRNEVEQNALFAGKTSGTTLLIGSKRQ